MIFLNLYLAKSKKSYYICLALVNNFENVIKKGGEIRLCETLATLQILTEKVLNSTRQTREITNTTFFNKVAFSRIKNKNKIGKFAA